MNRNPKRGDFPAHVEPVDLADAGIVESEPTNGGSIRYGRWSDHRGDLDEDQWGIVEYASGSDYSGGSVTAANYKSLSEMLSEKHPEGTPVVWMETPGGHGTYGIVVRYFQLDPEIRETIDALEDYPIIDEQVMSSIESEAENEAWERRVKDDFQKHFLKRWNEQWPDGPEVEDWPDSVTDGMTYTMFNYGMNEGNVNWITEEDWGGSGPHVDLKNVIDPVVDLLSGGQVPSWMSPDDFSEMLEVAKAFGMEPTTAEREHRGQQRLPHVKNAAARTRIEALIREAARTDLRGLNDQNDPSGLQRAALSSVARQPRRSHATQAARACKGAVELREVLGEVDDHVQNARPGAGRGFEHETLQAYAGRIAEADTNADAKALRRLSEGPFPKGLSKQDLDNWRLLRLFATYKGDAVLHRLAGRISMAKDRETWAEGAYQRLPANLKW